MNKIDILRDLVAHKPVKKILSTFWGHFFKEEQHWETLLQKTVEFQKTFDWDLVKINPSSTFIAEAWGNRYAKFDDRKQELLECLIRQPEDFLTLPPLDPLQGIPGDHLKLIQGLKRELPDIPLIMTIFSPLSYAGRLCGGADKLAGWIKESARGIEEGLQTITECTVEFIQACFESGCHGIFYATTEWGDSKILSRKEYEQYGTPFDVKILDFIKQKSLFTIFHVCRSNNRLRDLLNYPVDALSWDWQDRENPQLEEIAEISGKIVIGGISQKLLESTSNSERIREEVEDFCKRTKDHRAILGPGCTFSAYHKEIFQFIRNVMKDIAMKSPQL